MNQVVIKQVTDEEIIQQEELKQQFISAILSENIAKITQLLDPRGCFFGKFNRGQAMVYLIKKFDKVKNIPDRENMNISQGYSFDHQPKQDVIEFRFSVYGSDFIDDTYSPPSFGTAKRPEFNEGIIRLAIEFKDDKIFSIRHPKKVIRDIVEIARRN
jgi:hypothetical protein